MSVIEGKTVLVTGGTGSFGRVIVDEVLRRSPARVRVLARTEKSHINLYGIPVLHSYGDVARYEDVLAASRGVDIIIHAAAMKHVPICEKNVFAMCNANVTGSANVLMAAHLRGAKLVGISTDKVCGDSMMGLSKRLMERMFAQEGFNCVRMGNLVPSEGSVFPLWKAQIAQEKPLTITSPRMTRFLISLQDAARFVMATLEYGEPGEVWIPRIKSARMIDVANAMIGTKSLGVVEIGVRPGEQLHEQMFTAQEAAYIRAVNDHFVLGLERAEYAYGLPYDSREHLMSKSELAEMVRVI